ncbi:hypothetical protein LTR85_006625 [Meristemomyces frigidus]|nr:hypothetical protein LTR85_006625 [Meristemomyces frigidus]
MTTFLILVAFVLATCCSVANAQLAIANNATLPTSFLMTRPQSFAPFLNVTQSGAFSHGYIFIGPYQHPGAGAYIYDKFGNLVWDGFGVIGSANAHDFKVCQYLGSPHLCVSQVNQQNGYAVGQGLIIDSDYRVVQSVQTGRDAMPADMHDFQLLDNASGPTALLTSYRAIPYDLSAFNIRTGQGWLLEGMFQEVVVGNTAEFAGDGFSPSTAFDYFHLNSVDKSLQTGNYLVSARHTSAIYYINATDQSVIWQISFQGQSDFTCSNFNFSFQHDARIISEGATTTEISMFDNGQDCVITTSPQSSGRFISIDHNTGVATEIRRTLPPDEISSCSQGNTQLLPDGHVFQGWGDKAWISEVDENNDLVLAATFTNVGDIAHDVTAMNYRAFSFEWESTPSNTIPSVYSYALNTDTTNDIYVSWNGATTVSNWRYYGCQQLGDAFEVIGTTSVRGFETVWSAPLFYPWVMVEAVVVDGTSLANSSYQPTFVPSSTLAPHCNEVSCPAVTTYAAMEYNTILLFQPSDISMDCTGEKDKSGAPSSTTTLKREASNDPMLPEQRVSKHSGPIKKRKGKEQHLSNPYEDKNEELPRLPIYHPSFKEAEKLVPTICDTVLNEIKDLRTRGYQDDKIDRLAESLVRLRLPEQRYPTAKRIGFLGVTAAGKSSLVNCLLNQQGLAVESDDGSSGTCVIQAFVKAPPDQVEAYQATIYFHDTKKVEMLVKKYFRDIYDYSKKDEVEAGEGEGKANEVDEEELQAKNETATEFFRALLCDQKEFRTEELIVQHVASAASCDDTNAIAVMLRLILALLTDLTPTEGRMLFKKDKLREIAKALKTVCRESNAAEGKSSPWPLISRVQIQMRSRLLEEGIMLVDLPGVTDTNQIRVDATKDYFKSCSCIVIAHPIERIVDHTSVFQNLRECARRGKFRNVVVVPTKTDDMKLKKLDVDIDEELADWSDEDQTAMQGLQERCVEIQGEIADLEDLMEEASGAKLQDLKAKKLAKEHQLAQAEAYMSQKQLQVRNTIVSEKLLRKCMKSGPEGEAAITIACVSSRAYQAHLVGYDMSKPPRLTVIGTGIPKLRGLFYRLPAQGKFAALEVICREELPLALNALELRCGRTLLERRSEVEAEVARPREQCSRVLGQVKRELMESFNKHILRFMASKEAAWSVQAQRLGEVWARHKAMRFRAICRHNGIWAAKRAGVVIRINWNIELIEIVEKDLTANFAEMAKVIDEVEAGLSTKFETLIDELASGLKHSPHLMGFDLEPFFESMRIRKDAIANHIKNSLDPIKAALDSICCDTFSDGSAGYIRKAMEEAYTVAASHNGSGSHAKRLKNIKDKLNGSKSPFVQTAEMAKHAFEAALGKWVKDSNAEIAGVFVDIHQDLEARFAAVEDDDESERDFRMRLLEMVIKAKKMMGPLRDHLKRCSEYH